MGQPKFARKKYETPNHPWQGERIKSEHELRRKFGLKNKTEIWKAQSRLRTIRGQARELVSRTRNPDDEQAQAEAKLLLRRLHREGYVGAEATLNEVLGLDVERILNRRLQSQVYLKGMARTPKQARQFVSHGLVAIGERRVTVPGYVVRREDEELIQFAPDATVADPDHPVRPKAPGQEVVAESTTVPHGTGGQSVSEKPTEGDAPVKTDAAPTVTPSQGERAETAQREAPPGKAPPAGEAKKPAAAPEAAKQAAETEAPAKQAAAKKAEAPAKQATEAKEAPAAQTEQPKAEAPAKQATEAKDEAPAAQTEQPKSDAPAAQAEEPKSEAPAKQATEAKDEAPAAQTEEPKSEAPAAQTEQPKSEAPAKQAEEPEAKAGAQAEEPVEQAPATEEPPRPDPSETDKPKKARADKPEEVSEDPATQPKSKTGSDDKEAEP